MFMKVYLTCLALLFFAGCTSTRKANLKAREAYIQGQQEAMAQVAESKNPSVFVQGNVKNSKIPWTEGLTLSQTIVAAEYQGITTPRTIRLVRNRQPTDIKASELLKGQDVPVLAGDQIIILY